MRKIDIILCFTAVVCGQDASRVETAAGETVLVEGGAASFQVDTNAPAVGRIARRDVLRRRWLDTWR